MISNEQCKELKIVLEREFVRIRMKAMVAFDGECICLAAELDKLRRDRNIDPMGSDLRNLKKRVTIELDLHAVEILSALRRMHEKTYGECVECGDEISYDDLFLNPTLRFCDVCRVHHEPVKCN